MLVFSNAAGENQFLFPPLNGNGQRNLVVLIVDQISAPQPLLKGVWLLVTYPGDPTINLVPIYPKPGPDQSAGVPYAQAFGITPDQKPVPQFLDLLSENFLWNYYLVIDRNSTSAMIELIQEVPFTKSGDENLAFEAFPPSGGTLDFDSLDMQLQLWEMVCGYLSQASHPGQFELFLEQVSPGFQTNFNWNELPLYPMQASAEGGELGCKFPTLKLEIP
ncbi:MAG: hypothetical protein ACWGOY_01680 [Anaerolineales bacterium]